MLRGTLQSVIAWKIVVDCGQIGVKVLTIAYITLVCPRALEHRGAPDQAPWRPTCCFAPVTLFETVKVRMLECLLHEGSNATVMVHSQRVSSAAGPQMLRGEAPLPPTGSQEVI